MFSIIIPLYNKSEHIQKAIDSVLAQTYNEYELIVINDGSTDNSLDRIKSINLNSIEYKIIDQANVGVSTTRNNGVKIAKYPYIAFLDADDWWEPTFLEEMKNLILEYPDASIYGSGYYIVKNNIKKEDTIGVDKSFKHGLINYCKVYSKTLCMPLWTGATIVRKNVFDNEKGFKPELKMGEDFDLWIRIALKYPVAFLNKRLSNYNQDVDIKSRAVDYFKTYDPKSFFIFNLEYLKKTEDSNSELKDLLDKLRVYALLQYRIQNTYNEAYKKEIAKVDFTKFSLSTRLQYRLPRILIRSWFQLRIKIMFLIRKGIFF